MPVHQVVEGLMSNVEEGYQYVQLTMYIVFAFSHFRGFKLESLRRNSLYTTPFYSHQHMELSPTMHAPISFLTIFAGMVLATCNMSLGACDEQPKPPNLEYLFTVQATESPPVIIGASGHGNRIFIPITGGTFSGPKLQGKCSYQINYMVDHYSDFRCCRHGSRYWRRLGQL